MRGRATETEGSEGGTENGRRECQVNDRDATRTRTNEAGRKREPADQRDRIRGR